MIHPIQVSIGMIALLAAALSSASAAPPSAGCGPAGWRSGTYTMDHNGMPRSFRLHVPQGFENEKPAPLVLLLHGWGGDENEFLAVGGVASQADRRGYILAAPRGLGSGAPDHGNNSWSFSGSATGLDGDGVNEDRDGDTEAVCDPGITPDYSYASCENERANSCSWTHCQDDDVAFAVALVGRLREKLCIDPDRVFAVGGSNGGMFTWALGQNTASAPLFRAIAPLIGLPHRAYLAAKGKQGSLPVLLITGTRDEVVPPGEWEDPSYTTSSNGNDRFHYTGATAITRSWAEAHGCDTGAAAVPFDDGIEETDCRTYCAAGPDWPEVLDCRAHMGHDYGLSWSWGLVLDFFDRHSG